MAAKAVVIAFDRLSSGALGCYGNIEVNTPRFDQLAAESVVFDQHFGGNFDPAARDHAWWTGCQQFLRTPDQQSACAHLADLLRAAGVSTRMIRDASAESSVPGETRFDEVWPLDMPAGDDAFGRQCRDTIDKWVSETPQTGLLWWQDPGLTSSDQLGRTEMLDRRLGIILDRLDDLSDENLLTIVTAAEGSLRGDQSKLLTGERPLAEEQVHTPLLIRAPQTFPGGTRRQSLVQTIDLPPTLLDWFGVSHRQPRCDGHSLIPILRDNNATDVHECLFLGERNRTAAIRTFDWYLIGTIARSDETGQVRLLESGRRLYLKPDDLWDIQDVAAQAPRETAELAERLEKFLVELESA